MIFTKWGGFLDRVTHDETSIAVICTALLFAVVTLAYVAVQTSLMHEEVYHEYAASKANADAQEKFSHEYSGLTVIEEVIRCFEDAVESAREPQRSEEDLHAQKQMAKWAAAMFWVSFLTGVVSVAVAAIGVVLVRKTLNAQRIATDEAAKATRAAVEANKVAREAYVADQRPWVSARVAMGGPITWDENGCNLTFQVILENTGKTPALKVDVRLKARALYGSFDLVKEQIELADMIRRDPYAMGTALFSNQTRTILITASIPNADVIAANDKIANQRKPRIFPIHPANIGCVNYFSFLQSNHQTGLIFHVVKCVSADQPVAVYQDEQITADDLMLRAWSDDGRTD